MELSEFEAGLEKRPELMGEIIGKYVDTIKTDLTGRGLHVATTDEYTKDREAAIGRGTKEAHEAWEGFFSEVTGQPKPEGKKGIDWAKENRDKIRFGDQTADQVLTQQVTNLTKANKDLEKALEKERSGVFQARADSLVDAGIGALKFRVPTDLSDETQKASYLRDQAEANRQMFLSKYTPEKTTDGRVVFKDKAGTLLIDDKGAPLTVEQIFANNHGYLLQPTGFSQGGTGGGQQQQQQQGEGFLGATTEEIRTALAKLGKGVGTKEWTELYEKAHTAAGYVKENGYFVKK